MLPKERDAINAEHETPNPLPITVGNRAAWHVGHFKIWEFAQHTAFYVATDTRLRCFVIWCEKHEEWMVWRTNVTCRVKTREDVLNCKQCGRYYSSRACGPTHALQAYRLELTGVELP